MNTVLPRTPPLLPTAAAVALTLLAVAGLLREERSGWGGFIYSPQRIVDVVEPGSAAATAGLQEGDSVISVDGRPSVEIPMQSRWALTRPGETRQLLVLREGRPVGADVVYTRKGPNLFARGALDVLIAFLWCGLWVRLTVPTAPARALWRIGLAAGVAAAAVPSVGGVWNGIVSHVQIASLVLLTMFVLHFFLVFPAPKRLSGSRSAAVAALGAWVAFVAYLAVELLVHPRFYLMTGNVGGALMLVFGVLALVAMAHTLAKAPRGELWASGMGWALIGVGMTLVAVLAPFVGMALGLPSAMTLALLIGLFPVALALAVRKQARHGGAQS